MFKNKTAVLFFLFNTFISFFLLKMDKTTCTFKNFEENQKTWKKISKIFCNPVYKNKLYSNLPLLYQHMFLCVNESTHFNWVL